jgi:RimJ/RimL family protein N-acetyltransferase
LTRQDKNTAAFTMRKLLYFYPAVQTVVESVLTYNLNQERTSKMIDFVPLATARLTLRRLTSSDSETMFFYRSNPDVARYQNWEKPDLQAIRSFCLEMESLDINVPGTWFQLAVVLNKTGAMIGEIGLHFTDDDNQQVEIGITLDPTFQGKGFAAEALTAVIDFLFGALKKHRIYASVDPRNHASIALLERMGMRKEAHFRESLWFKGAWADDVIYAVLQREWLS